MYLGWVCISVVILVDSMRVELILSMIVWVMLWVYWNGNVVLGLIVVVLLISSICF